MDSYTHPKYPKLKISRRSGSPFWQTAVYFEKGYRRISTKEKDKLCAEEFASDWYENLLASRSLGISKFGNSFKSAAHFFLKEFDGLVQNDERSRSHYNQYEMKLKRYLVPFFGKYNVK